MGLRRLMLKYSYFCLRRLTRYYTEGNNMKLDSYKGKLIKVKRKSRGRFDVPVAVKGDMGIVVEAWQGTVGTGKFKLIKKDGSLVATTLPCVDKLNKCEHQLSEEWFKLQQKHIEENLIPVIVIPSVPVPSSACTPLGGSTAGGSVRPTLRGGGSQDTKGLLVRKPTECGILSLGKTKGILGTPHFVFIA